MSVPPRQPEAALPPLVAFLANRTERDTSARIETQAEQADREFRDWTRRIAEATSTRSLSSTNSITFAFTNISSRWHTGS